MALEQAEPGQRDSLAAVYASVEDHLGFLPTPYPYQILTVHGQKLTLRHVDGSWVDDLVVETIGVGGQHLRWGAQVHPNPVIEWIVRSLIIERMQTYVRTYSAVSLLGSIRSLTLCQGLGDNDNHRLVMRWALDACAAAIAPSRPWVRNGVLAFIEFLIDLEAWGFDEQSLTRLRSRVPKSWEREYVTALDLRYGPYTTEELGRINDCLETNESVTSLERSIIGLCRDWGLRPVQMALLKWKDFRQDELGPYLTIPSVKGRQRSKQRRDPEHFKKRYITEQTAISLRALYTDSLKHVDEVIAQLGLDDCSCHLGPERPIFFRLTHPRRASRLLNDEALSIYALHTTASTLSRVVRSLTARLRVPIDDPAPDGQTCLIIAAHRFRKTKATSLVLQGCSPAEVAEALDHMTVSSVKHYFMYSKDVESDIRNRFSTKAIQASAQRWVGRIEPVAPSTEGRPGRPILDLGMCMRTDDCEYWPTVTCYSCSRFRPSAIGRHEDALRHIEQVRHQFQHESSGPFRRLLDGAAHGARAVIMACAKVNEPSQSD